MSSALLNVLRSLLPCLFGSRTSEGQVSSLATVVANTDKDSRASSVSSLSEQDDDDGDYVGLPEQLLHSLGIRDVLQVGKGTFGSVFTGKLRRGHPRKYIDLGVGERIMRKANGEIAIKLSRYDGEVFFSPSQDNYFREIETLRILNHRSVVTMFTSFSIEDKRPSKNFDARDHFGVMLMERLGVSLSKIRKELEIDYFEENEIMHIFDEIGNALAYLHERNVTHNDLHAGNFVLSSSKGNQLDRSRFFTSPLKLIDFGRSHRFSLTNLSYFRSEHISHNALQRWRGEPEQRDQVPSNGEQDFSDMFLSESCNFARCLMKLSVPKDLIVPPLDLQLDEVFARKSSLRSAKLRQALLMMSSSDTSNRISIAHALQLVQNVSG